MFTLTFADKRLYLRKADDSRPDAVDYPHRGNSSKVHNSTVTKITDFKNPALFHHFFSGPKEDVIRFLQKENLILSKFTCPKCNTKCKIFFKSRLIDKHNIQCDNKHSFPIRKFSFFSLFRLPLVEVWEFIINYLDQMKLYINADRCGINYNNTAVVWAEIVRDIMCHKIWKIYFKNEFKLSGYVEADETDMGRKIKHHRGKAVGRKVSVFGMVERKTGRSMVFPIEDKSSVTLVTIVNQFVNKDGVMVTDGLISYNSLDHLHFNLIHKTEFVTIYVDMATGLFFKISTNRVEANWRVLKAMFIEMNGTSSDKFESYLVEYMYRNDCKVRNVSLLEELSKDITDIFPLDGTCRLEFPTPFFPTWQGCGRRVIQAESVTREELEQPGKIKPRGMLRRKAAYMESMAKDKCVDETVLGEGEETDGDDGNNTPIIETVSGSINVDVMETVTTSQVIESFKKPNIGDSAGVSAAGEKGPSKKTARLKVIDEEAIDGLKELLKNRTHKYLDGLPSSGRVDDLVRSASDGQFKSAAEITDLDAFMPQPRLKSVKPAAKLAAPAASTSRSSKSSTESKGPKHKIKSSKKQQRTVAESKKTTEDSDDDFETTFNYKTPKRFKDPAKEAKRQKKLAKTVLTKDDNGKLPSAEPSLSGIDESNESEKKSGTGKSKKNKCRASKTNQIVGDNTKRENLEKIETAVVPSTSSKCLTEKDQGYRRRNRLKLKKLTHKGLVAESSHEETNPECHNLASHPFANEGLKQSTCSRQETGKTTTESEKHSLFHSQDCERSCDINKISKVHVPSTSNESSDIINPVDSQSIPLSASEVSNINAERNKKLIQTKIAIRRSRLRFSIAKTADCEENRKFLRSCDIHQSCDRKKSCDSLHNVGVQFKNIGGVRVPFHNVSSLLSEDKNRPSNSITDIINIEDIAPNSPSSPPSPSSAINIDRGKEEGSGTAKPSQLKKSKEMEDQNENAADDSCDVVITSVEKYDLEEDDVVEESESDNEQYSVDEEEEMDIEGSEQPPKSTTDGSNQVKKIDMTLKVKQEDDNGQYERSATDFNRPEGTGQHQLSKEFPNLMEALSQPSGQPTTHIKKETVVAIPETDLRAYVGNQSSVVPPHQLSIGTFKIHSLDGEEVLRQGLVKSGHTEGRKDTCMSAHNENNHDIELPVIDNVNTSDSSLPTPENVIKIEPVDIPVPCHMTGLGNGKTTASDDKGPHEPHLFKETPADTQTEKGGEAPSVPVSSQDDANQRKVRPSTSTIQKPSKSKSESGTKTGGADMKYNIQRGLAVGTKLNLKFCKDVNNTSSDSDLEDINHSGRSTTMRSLSTKEKRLEVLSDALQDILKEYDEIENSKSDQNEFDNDDGIYVARNSSKRGKKPKRLRETYHCPPGFMSMQRIADYFCGEEERNKKLDLILSDLSLLKRSRPELDVIREQEEVITHLREKNVALEEEILKLKGIRKGRIKDEAVRKAENRERLVNAFRIAKDSGSFPTPGPLTLAGQRSTTTTTVSTAAAGSSRTMTDDNGLTPAGIKKVKDKLSAIVKKKNVKKDEKSKKGNTDDGTLQSVINNSDELVQTVEKAADSVPCTTTVTNTLSTRCSSRIAQRRRKSVSSAASNTATSNTTTATHIVEMAEAKQSVNTPVKTPLNTPKKRGRKKKEEVKDSLGQTSGAQIKEASNATISTGNSAGESENVSKPKRQVGRKRKSEIKVAETSSKEQKESHVKLTGEGDSIVELVDVESPINPISSNGDNKIATSCNPTDNRADKSISTFEKEDSAPNFPAGTSNPVDQSKYAPSGVYYEGSHPQQPNPSQHPQQMFHYGNNQQRTQQQPQIQTDPAINMMMQMMQTFTGLLNCQMPHNNNMYPNQGMNVYAPPRTPIRAPSATGVPTGVPTLASHQPALRCTAPPAPPTDDYNPSGGIPASHLAPSAIRPGPAVGPAGGTVDSTVATHGNLSA